MRAGVVIFAAVICAGCITGDIVSGEQQRPPRIPFNQVDPPPGLVVISDPDAQLPMTFRVLRFEDPNINDTLAIRWFVDYHRNPAIQRQVVRPPELDSATPQLRSGSSFTLTLSMMEPNPTADPHLLEVVVTDRPFDDPGQETRLNRTFSEGAEGDVLSWTIQITAAVASKPAGSGQGVDAVIFPKLLSPQWPPELTPTLLLQLPDPTPDESVSLDGVLDARGDDAQ